MALRKSLPGLVSTAAACSKRSAHGRILLNYTCCALNIQLSTSISALTITSGITGKTSTKCQSPVKLAPNFNSNHQCFPLRSISSSQIGGNKDFIFKQLMDYQSYTYTYLLADAKSREAILIDPVIEMADRDIQVIKDLGLTLKYAVNTHVHADHVTGSGVIKKRINGCKSMIAEVSGAKADVKLKAGDLIKFGEHSLEVRSTPGHTDGCLSYVWHDKKVVFTGDALLIRGCGRTDFQQGDSGVLYDSVHKQILSLPDDFFIYPAHDYTGQTSSTVGEEKKLNRRLTRPKEEFVKIMSELKLPYPKQIDKALPANMVCGIYDESDG